jgi:hypothetical protein
MDRFIKLPSIEGGNLTASNNRLVFHLPEGTEYKIDDGFINVYTRVSTVDRVAAAGAALGKQGVHNLEFLYTGAEAKALKGEDFVKNARMRSRNQGILEDTRRVNVLNAMLSNFENSTEDEEGMRYTTAGQLYNKTQLKENIFREFYKEGTNKSVELLTPIRIPIKKVFRGISSLPYIPTSVVGGVDIEIELDLANITVQNPHEYPEDAETVAIPNTAPPPAPQTIDLVAGNYKICDDVPSAGAGQTTDTTKLTITAPFLELGYSPYYTGQLVQVNYFITGSGAAPRTQVYRIINEISFSNDKKITLTFDEGFDTSGTQNLAYEEIFVDITSPHIDYTTTYEYAEILIKEVVAPVPKEELGELIYRPFSTEEHSTGGGVSSYQKLFYCEPESVNLFVTFPEAGIISHILTTTGANDGTYRLSIDNVSLTNRDVRFHSPLHYDLLEKTFRNGELTIRNFDEKVVNCQSRTLTNRTGNGRKLQVVATPLPLKQSEKLVQVNLDTTANFNKMVLFKQLEKVIKL